MKPWSAACDRNQVAIGEALAPWVPQPCNLLELGSGTGQHAVYLRAALTHVTWQPSDLPPLLNGIQQWVDEAALAQVLAPMALDANRRDQWPAAASFDAVFTANTLHYVDAATAENIVACAAHCLRDGGYCFIYGPFNEDGHFTSPGNAQLDAWVKQRAPLAGLKDTAWVRCVGSTWGLCDIDCLKLPSNNLLWVLRRQRDA